MGFGFLRYVFLLGHDRVYLGYLNRGGMVCLLLCLVATPPVRGAEIDFNREIRPILAEHCFACHGPDGAKRKGDLRLDSREGAVDSAVVPGMSAESELLRRVMAKDPDEMMPPFDSGKAPLTKSQIEKLRLWIDSGAKYDTHWSFVPPARGTPPLVDDERFNDHAIDRFAATVHQEKGLRPNPQADRPTLIRRLSLDLTGLPPSAEDVERFTGDKSPDAYSKLVDQLLSSKHYGEHQTRFWLDAARYADTNGYQYDLEREQWVWRDWVIDAFNKNMPFDQFTIEQLAGDLLPDASEQQKLATAFHRNHPITIEGGVIDEEYRTEYVVDRVVTTSTVWLGLTVGCARCHDHKYDPISQREFYEFFAYFNQVPERGLQGFDPRLKIESPLRQKQMEALDGELASMKADVERQLQTVEQWSQWETKAENDRQVWLPTNPTNVRSLGDATLTRQEDGSFLASGKNPATDVYEYDFEISAGEIDAGVIDAADAQLYAIQVEALTDPSFVNHGTGRAHNANFVLTEIEVVPLKDGVAGEKLPITSAVADYSQPRYPVAAAINGAIDKQGWAVDGNTKFENRSAYFVLAQPKTFDSPIRVRLIHQFGGNHQIGRFRISYSAKPVRSLPPELASLLATPAEERSADQSRTLRIELARRYGDANIREAILGLDQAQARRDNSASVPSTMVMSQMPNPRKTFILDRGQYNEPRDEVQPATPRGISNLPPAELTNRLGLAKWIVDRKNPLTARVAVNRVWRQLFGEGLVETTGDFGTQGAYPSHPQLLDWLAVEFMESGWDVKALFKQIVLSETYRQSSQVRAEHQQVDPNNRWLSRGPRMRLDAEVIRDSALAVSGLLHRDIGGASVFPYHPPGLWQEINNRPGYSRVYKQDQGEKLYRRSMYTFWKRTVPPPSLAAFDAPEREYCVVRRSRTNTPLQAFVMLNDPQFVEAARELGRRMFEHDATDDARLRYGFLTALGRQPAASEVEVLARALAERRVQYDRSPDQAKAVLSVGDSPMPIDQLTEHAAWATIGRILLNLSEFVTKG
jgi:hypothetical protein